MEKPISDWRSYQEAEDQWLLETGIEVGTKVRVTRKAVEGELGWANAWVDDRMFLGEFYVLSSGTTGTGMELSPRLKATEDEDANGGRIAYSYPYFVLEIIK